jgi:catechol 2,3-dioxygenase-like lactoylglutathione lyase family enzyme
MAKGKIVAIGHVGIRVPDVAAAVGFYRGVLGLKHVVKSAYFNAFEVGDAHFCIMPGKPRKQVHFDFTADDVDALRARLTKERVVCTKAQDDRMSGHRCFTLVDPWGHNITVYSAHHEMPDVSSAEP